MDTRRLTGLVSHSEVVTVGPRSPQGVLAGAYSEAACGSGSWVCRYRAHAESLNTSRLVGQTQL